MGRGAGERLREEWGPALPGVEAGPGPICSAGHAGLDFVCSRRNGAHWAEVRSGARSCSPHRILCFFALEPWNSSFCACKWPGTTNIHPNLQNGGLTPQEFVPQTPGNASGALTQSGWGLVFSYSPLLYSRSLGPLAWPRVQERKGLFDLKPQEWLVALPGLGARIQGQRADPASAEPSAFLRRSRSAPPGKTWAWTFASRVASTWRKKISSFGSRGPWLCGQSGSPHSFLLATNWRPLPQNRSVATSTGAGGGAGIGEKHSRFSGSIVSYKEPQASTTKNDAARPARF